MSEQQTKPEENVQVKKEVTLIGYASDDAPSDLREFAAEVTGKPCDEFEYDEHTTVTVELDLGGSWTSSKVLTGNYFDSDRVEEIKAELENEGVEWASVETDTKTTKEWERSLSSVGRQLLEEITEGLPEEIWGATRDSHMSARWSYDDGRSPVSVRLDSWDERRVLAKESERSSDDLYETLSEKNSVCYQIELEADSEEKIDELTDLVVPEMHKALSKQDGIGKVRYMDCKVTTEREGECYNI